MNIKRFISAICFVGALTVQAQDCEMPISVVLDDNFVNVPTAANNVLYQSLNRIATTNGLTTEGLGSSVILTAHCDVLDKSNLPGPPIQTVYNLGLTFYIADTFTQKKFASAYIEISGVGTGEVKSYINAFKSINAKNAEIKNLIKVGKANMMKYYDTQYHNILKEAKRYASLQQYEEALTTALSIPFCSKGGDEAYDYVLTLYTKYLDRMNLFLLNKAKSLWAAGQKQEDALEVCALLAQIDPEAACYKDASKLMAEIKSQVRSDIDFEMRQKYNDAVALEKQRIEAARAIGVAYGNNQKPTTTNLMWLK